MTSRHFLFLSFLVTQLPAVITAQGVCINGACTFVGNGRFADCTDCKRYYICEGGLLKRQSTACPSILLYDSVTAACAEAADATCSTTPAVSQTSAVSRSPSATSMPSEQSLQSQQSMTSQSSPSSGTSQTSATSGTSGTSQQSMTSPSQTSQTPSATSETAFCISNRCGGQYPQGYYADCSDCTSYFECDNENDIDKHYTCKHGLLYDDTIEQCNFQSSVSCSTTSGTSATSQSSQTSQPSATSQPSSQSSTSGTSQSSLTSEVSMTSEPIFCIDITLSSPCDVAGQTGVFAACGDCSAFLICTAAVQLVSRCGGGYLFNSATGTCDSGAGVVCATTTTTSLTSASTTATSEQSPLSQTSVTSQSSQTSMTSETSEEIFCLSDLSQCANVPVSRYAKCDDCQQFVDCIFSTITTCSAGSYFQPSILNCDAAGSVVCQTTSATSATSETSPTSMSSLTSQQSSLSLTSILSRQSSTSVTSMTSMTSEEIVCINSCTRIPEGFYADCGNCAQYFICGTGGSEEIVDCSPLYFNSQTETCDLTTNSICATTSATSPQSLTSGTSITSESSQTSVTSQQSSTSDLSLTSMTSPESATSTAIYCLNACSDVDGVFAFCGDCRSYLVCTNGNEEMVTCQSPLFYNPTTEACSFTDMCQTTSAVSMTSVTSESSPTSGTSATSQQSSVSLTSQTSVSSELSLTSEAPFCVNSCTDSPIGIYPDCSSCDGYHMCNVGGTTEKRTCESGLYFEPGNKRCGLDSSSCQTTSMVSISNIEGSGEMP